MLLILSCSTGCRLFSWDKYFNDKVLKILKFWKLSFTFQSWSTMYGLQNSQNFTRFWTAVAAVINSFRIFLVSLSLEQVSTNLVSEYFGVPVSQILLQLLILALVGTILGQCLPENGWRWWVGGWNVIWVWRGMRIVPFVRSWTCSAPLMSFSKFVKHELRPEPGLQHLMKMIFSNFVTFLMILTNFVIFLMILTNFVTFLMILTQLYRKCLMLYLGNYLSNLERWFPIVNVGWAIAVWSLEKYNCKMSGYLIGSSTFLYIYDWLLDTTWFEAASSSSGPQWPLVLGKIIKPWRTFRTRGWWW